MTTTRELAVLRLCGEYYYCVGLKRIGGERCPANQELLTISDIQIGHLKQNKLSGHKLYDLILSMGNPWKFYIPLCPTCNRRMVKLAEEQRRFSKEFRQRVARYLNNHWGWEAAKKFGVSEAAVSIWRKEFNITFYKPQRHSKQGHEVSK